MRLLLVFEKNSCQLGWGRVMVVEIFNLILHIAFARNGEFLSGHACLADGKLHA